MKRVILLTLSLLLGISSYAQTEWEIQPSTLKINASNSLDISNVSSNSVTLHNWIAESKENKKQNRITARNGILPLYVNGTSKRISFGIEDINNNPSQYKYPVQTANGKTEYTQDIYWGITVYMAGVDGKEYYIQYLFNNKGAKGGNYGIVNTYQSASCSFNMSGKGVLHGTFDNGWQSCSGLPTKVEIILQENNHCGINFNDYSIPEADFASVDGVRRVEFNLYAGAKIRVYNLKVERKSVYSKVSSFITAGGQSYA